MLWLSADRPQFPWFSANTDSSTAAQAKTIQPYYRYSRVVPVPTNTVNLYHGDTNNNY